MSLQPKNMTKNTTVKKKFLWLRRDWQLYAMMAIPIIWYLVFCYKPMTGLLIAFQKYNIFKGIKGSQWVGLENFKFVFQMRDFGIALKNTLWLNFLDLLIGFPIPIVLAIMLNEMRTPKFKKLSQTLLKCFLVLKLMVCPRYSRFSRMLQMVEEPQPYTSLKVLFLFTPSPCCAR